MQNRSLSERSAHTRSQRVNLSSIAIVLAGDFEKEYMTSEQLESVHALIKQLDSMYHFEKIIPHRDASPTACPGKNLLFQLEMFWRGDNEETGAEVYSVSRYYSPVEGQLRYYGGKTYLEDVKMNCGLQKDGSAGDCSTTANGYKLKAEDAYKVAACPPEMPFGTKLNIDGIGTVTCVDRGSAIKNKKIDVWAGYGEDGLRMIYGRNGGLMSVTRL